MDLKKWRLRIEGNVGNPRNLSIPELINRFEPISVAAVSQCSGNSRSAYQPRVPGGQWRDGQCAVDESVGKRTKGGTKFFVLSRAATNQPVSSKFAVKEIRCPRHGLSLQQQSHWR